MDKKGDELSVIKLTLLTHHCSLDMDQMIKDEKLRVFFTVEKTFRKAKRNKNV